MNILAIETSCDETSVAILREGRHVLSNIVSSQIDLHRRFGGVVPELASRQHIVNLVPVLEEALRVAEVGWDDIDAIAVTCGPGLAGALLVGLNAAKAIAFARSKPLIAVNHLEAHIYSNWVVPEGLESRGGSAESHRAARATAALRAAGYDPKRNAPPRKSTPDPQATEQTDPRFPLLCLIVSGGHTELVYMTAHGTYTRLGKTVDDAAGEAFDKVSRILGLGYPGGPEIQNAAESGNPNAFELPKKVMRGSFDFSFSGLKTAVLHKVQEFGPPNAPAEERGAEAEAVAEQVEAEAAALDRNRRARQETGELNPASLATPAQPTAHSSASAEPAGAHILGSDPAFSRAEVIERVVVKPVAAPSVESQSATVVESPTTEQEIVNQDEQPHLPGLLRLQLPDEEEGSDKGRLFEFKREPVAPIERRPDPTAPRVLGQDEPSAVAPPAFLAPRTEVAATEQPSQEQAPAEVQLPDFLLARRSGRAPFADTQAEQEAPQAEQPAPPAAVEPLPVAPEIVQPVAKQEVPQQSAPPPASRPSVPPTRMDAPRQQPPARSTDQPSRLRSVPNAPAPPAPRSETPAPRPAAQPDREIRAIPKSVQAGRTVPTDEEDDFDRRLDQALDDNTTRGRGSGADRGRAERQGQTAPQSWNNDDDGGDDDMPPTRSRGSVALEGPRRPGASIRVPRDKPAVEKPPLPVADVAASFQAAAVEILVDKVATVIESYEVKTVLIAGGVAANRLLRARLQQRLGTAIEVRYPPPALCTDNAAMVAAAAYFRYEAGLQKGWALDIDPNASYLDG